ncbi:MAG TPA: ABC transporter permease [Bacillota bacterium]|nr:ABC transporter permease [Bacillota bacterium]
MFRHVYVKEMIDTFRDRKTLFLSVLIPIIFSIGIVFFMDHILLADTPDKPVDVAINQTADQEVVDWIDEIDSVQLQKVSDPVQVGRDGDVLVAIDVQDDFIQIMEKGESPLVSIYAEPTSSKAENVVNGLMTMFTEKQGEIVASELQAADVNIEVLQPFGIDVQNLSGSDDGVSSFVISIIAQIVIVIAVMVGGLPASSDLFAGEKERKTMEALIMTPVNRIHILLGKWLTIATLGIMSGIFSVITLVVFVQLFTTNMKEALDLSNNVFYFTSSLIVGIIFFALLISALEMVISLFANTMKEAQNYVSPLMFLAMIPYFILIDVSPNEFTHTHFLIPFLNIYALIKQLVYGIYDITSILLVVGSSVVFILITLGIGMFMFSKSKWILGKSS